MGREAGLGLAEAVVVIALVGVCLLTTLPALAERRGEVTAAAGARQLAMALHALRWTCAAKGRYGGMLFERDGVGWGWRIFEDGNGNGVRIADVRRGVDRPMADRVTLERLGSGARLGFPLQGAIPAIPPSRGTLTDLDDPVRFGVNDLVSFSPIGTASSGTIYITDGRRALYAVVLFGQAGRVRVWRFDARTRRWTL